MELTLNVNDDLARKIRGLSVLSGKGASEITDDISGFIEDHINKKLLDSIGAPPESFVGSNMASLLGGDSLPIETPRPLLKHKYEPSTVDDESEDSFDMATGLGADESEFETYDTELPEEMEEPSLEEMTPLELSKDEAEEYGEEDDIPDEETGEEEMALKNKQGEPSNYDDPLMSSLQDELDSGDLDGVSDDYDFDNDEAEFENDIPARVSAAPHTVNDVSDGDLDILPMDYGIDKVSAEDGQKSGAMDFFNNAFSGLAGDKTARNTQKRKRIITEY